MFAGENWEGRGWREAGVAPAPGGGAGGDGGCEGVDGVEYGGGGGSG